MKEGIKRGAVGGLLGGIVMGMWMMMYYWLTGLDFWAPLGYIGHFILRDAHITAPMQVVVGLMVHMAMSIAIGAAIGLLPAMAKTVSLVRGLVIGIVIWLVMQYGVLLAFDPVAYDGLVEWAFAVGHVLYGGVVGYAVGLTGESRARQFALR